MLFYKRKCINCGKCKQLCANNNQKCSLCGNCVKNCPTEARVISGKKYTADEVISEILKDKRLYESSGGGVTFSGGECMMQIEFLEELLKRCKEKELHTAIDTAGNLPYDFFERVIPYTDLFLYDVKCYDKDKHEQYTGSSNEKILDNLAKLLDSDTPVWIRIPVISGINDSTEEIKNIKSFLDTYGKPEKVELLPYHALGENKYEALGKSAVKFSAPSEEQMRELNKFFK
jgi:pyruvate formate lyase activating enzyme